MDVNPRLLHKKFKSKLLARTVAISFTLMILGAVGPNFFDFTAGGHGVDETIASADFESRYAEAMLITLDEGFLEKTYSTTEGSKGVKGIFYHTIEPGETVSEIALDYDIPLAYILVNNDIYNPARVRVGTKLKIANGIIHKVKSKDTLSSIAKKYEAIEEDITEANDSIESDLIAGTEVVVPNAKKGLTVANTARGGGSASKFEVALSQANGKLLFPTVGKYTQYFHGGHHGLDIASTSSPPIYAADSGQVMKSQCGWNGGYGCHIIVSHGNGMKTLYAHMRRLDVTVGEYVSRGQVIGQMGNTGRVYGRTGIHLHFEVNIGGVKRNPLAFF